MAQIMPRNKRKMSGIRIKPKEGLWISYQLRLKGFTCRRLAAQLGIRDSTVSSIIRGLRSSRRVETALFQTLGFASFEAMIADSRGQGGIT